MKDNKIWLNQNDYTEIAYGDGYYYYRSEADHFYLYRSDESGQEKECLAKQVPCEIYAKDGWIYFSNVSDGRKLYRVHEDGQGMELVLPYRVERFVPIGDKFYCISDDGIREGIFSWSEAEGSSLVYEGDCQWANTDGEFLYIKAVTKCESEYDYEWVMVDPEGNKKKISDQYWEGFTYLDGYWYYYDYSNGHIMRTENIYEDGSIYADIPLKMEEQHIISCLFEKRHDLYMQLFVQLDDNGYLHTIWRYDEEEQRWDILYSDEESDNYLRSQDIDWEVCYTGNDYFQRINDKIFFKRFAGEGQGELWNWIDICTDETDVFEYMKKEMKVSASGDAYYYFGERAENVICDESVEKDDRGNEIYTTIEVPQIGPEIPGYENINRKIKEDAEDFCREQTEYAEYIRDASDEWKNMSIGYWKCKYFYEDSDHVSIVYHKGLGQNGRNMDTDTYVTKLYSSETGEEIQIEDLFCTDFDEVLLRLSFVIRKTKMGLTYFCDDMAVLDKYDSEKNSLDRNPYQDRFFLMREGIVVFFAEKPGMKVYYFLVNYEELEDILAKDV